MKAIEQVSASGRSHGPDNRVDAAGLLPQTAPKTSGDARPAAPEREAAATKSGFPGGRLEFCEECNHPIEKHGPDGCEFERGDTYESGFAPYAQGPCGCKAHEYIGIPDVPAIVWAHELAVNEQDEKRLAELERRSGCCE